jgi:ABC-type glycerol-3-phosphate transport system permease component
MSAIHPMRLAESRTSRAAAIAVVTVVSLLVLFPLVWTLRMSMRPRGAYIADPAGWGGGLTWSNFGAAWQAGLGVGLMNSLLVVPLAAVLAAALATLAGFALAKLPVVGRRVLTVLLVSTFAVPVTALAVPVFDQALQFGYLGTHLGLSFVYAGLFTGWGTIFMTSYYSGFPTELLEAARVDGAGSFRTFRSIALPLAAPAVVTILAMNFFMMWSDLIIALVMMPSAELQTMAVVVATLPSARDSSATTSAASAVLMLLPVLIVFAVSQRWLRLEVLSGAVKS